MLWGVNFIEPILLHDVA